MKNTFLNVKRNHTILFIFIVCSKKKKRVWVEIVCQKKPLFEKREGKDQDNQVKNDNQPHFNNNSD